MIPLLLLLAATSALGCELKPVQDLTTTEVRSSTILVSWTAPSAEDLECVRGYRICTNEKITYHRCKTLLNTAINEYKFHLTDVCSEYNISVVVLGENNVTSVPAFVQTITAPYSVDKIIKSRKDNDTITVAWNFKPLKGVPCAAEFQLSYCNVRLTNCTTKSIPVSGEDYALDFHKTRDCNGYALIMTVLGPNGQKSDDRLYPYLGPPDLVDAPDNLRATRQTSSSFVVEWTIPASQVNCEYFVHLYIYSKVGQSSYSYTNSYNDGRNNQTQTRLTSCTAYEVGVHFGNFSNEETPSIIAYTLPKGDEVFNNVTIPEETSCSVTVAWTTSLSNNQCIAAYTVCWKKQGATVENCRNATREDSDFKITLLEANTSYVISVAALLETGVNFDKETLKATTKPGPRSTKCEQ